MFAEPQFGHRFGINFPMLRRSFILAFLCACRSLTLASNIP
jgi:hypothetical protein